MNKFVNMPKTGSLQTRRSGTTGSHRRAQFNKSTCDLTRIPFSAKWCGLFLIGEDMTNQVIECRNLWKVFGDKQQAAMEAIQSEGLSKTQIFEQFQCVVGVQNVSFSVSEGEIFCIMGLSGSGKSTLIRHVNRLIEPSAGQVLIEGTDINGMSVSELRSVRATKIGMVFQNMALLPHRSVADNVSLGLELRGEEEGKCRSVAEEILTRVDLAGWGDRFPDELSGGMKQRVGLARALAADPHILLMDEPFSALDPLIRRDLQTQFMRLAAEMGKTTLFITHDLDEAIRIGNRIAIMKDGTLIQTGTPEDIVTNPQDGYVADFVAGISRLNLVTAAKIMETPEAYTLHSGPFTEDGASTAKPDDKLDTLVSLAAQKEGPILIRDTGKTVGVVSIRSLLSGIQSSSSTLQENDHG